MDEKTYIGKLLSLYSAKGEESNHALAIADEATKAFPRSAKLWCIRGDLIQLGTAETSHELSDALASYEQAIVADSNFVEAYESIGYFYDVVMADSKRAVKFFKKAKQLKTLSDS